MVRSRSFPRVLTLAVSVLVACAVVPWAAAPALAAGPAISKVVTSKTPPGAVDTTPSMPAGSDPVTVTVTGSGFAGFGTGLKGSLAPTSGTATDLPLTLLPGTTDTSITATIDLSLADVGTYTLSLADAAGVTASHAITVTGSALTVTAVDPPTAVPEAGGQHAFTITGTGFTRSATVTFGGDPVTTVDVRSGTTIAITVPLTAKTAPGPYPVTVTEPGLAADRSADAPQPVQVGPDPTTTLDPFPYSIVPGGITTETNVRFSNTAAQAVTLTGQVMVVQVSGLPAGTAASHVRATCVRPDTGGPAVDVPLGLIQGVAVGLCPTAASGFTVAANDVALSTVGVALDDTVPTGSVRVTAGLSELLSSGGASALETLATQSASVDAVTLTPTWTEAKIGATTSLPLTLTNPGPTMANARLAVHLTGLGPELSPGLVDMTCQGSNGSFNGIFDLQASGQGVIDGTCGDPSSTSLFHGTVSVPLSIEPDSPLPTGTLTATLKVQRMAVTNATAGVVAGTVGTVTTTLAIRGKPGLPRVAATTSVDGAGNGQADVTYPLDYDGNDGPVSYVVKAQQCADPTCTKLTTGIPSIPAAPTSTTASHTVLGPLRPGKFYEVTVVPHNTDGDGSTGTLDSVRVYAPPGPPSNVTTEARDGALLVSFDLPEVNAAVVDDYTMTATPQPGSPVTTAVTITSPGSPALIGGLVNGITYTVTVTPDVPDNSKLSARGTGSPVGTPSAPTALAAQSHDRFATVTFAPPTTNPYMVRDYQVVLVPEGGGSTQSVTGTTSPLSVADLIDGKTYDVSIVARGTDGSSSPPATTTVVPYGPPGPPTSVTAVAGDAKALVGFSAPDVNPGVVTSYLVRASASGRPTVEVPASAPGTVVVGGLTNGLVWTFVVIAHAAAAPDAVSSPATATPFGAPGAPTGPVLTPVAGAVIVTGSSLGDDGGSARTGWVVTVTPQGGAPRSVATTVLPVRVDGLDNGVPVTATVAAVTAGGRGPDGPASAPVTPRAHPTLSIGAVPGLITEGHPVVLKGEVLAGPGDVPGGRLVTLVTATDLATTSRQLITGADGTFSLVVHPSRPTTFTFSTVDTDADGPVTISSSQSLLVRQEPTLGRITQDGTTLIVKGTVSPMMPSSGHVVVALWTLGPRGQLLDRIATAGVTPPKRSGRGEFRLAGTVPVPSTLRFVVLLQRASSGPSGSRSSVFVRRQR